MTANKLRIAAPSTTIWGRVQHRQKLAEGVYSVETASHGGVVVSELIADKYMSDKAMAVIGNPEHGWWHFEEDCEWAIFANENRDIVPPKWLYYIDGSLQQWNTDYLTMTADEIRAKREKAHREAIKAQQRYETRKAKEDSYRRQLTGEWDGEEKTFTTSDDITVVTRKTDKPDRFLCRILVGDGEPGSLELDTDFLLTLLMDCKKKTE